MMSKLRYTIDEMNSLLAKVESLSQTDVMQGLVGPAGEIGIQGIAGQNGINGRDGQDGKDGQNGINGRDGKDGKNGLNGRDGRNGERGLQGPAGKDGEVIIANGTTIVYVNQGPNIIEQRNNEVVNNNVKVKHSMLDLPINQKRGIIDERKPELRCIKIGISNI